MFMYTRDVMLLFPNNSIKIWTLNFCPLCHHFDQFSGEWPMYDLPTLQHEERSARIFEEFQSFVSRWCLPWRRVCFLSVRRPEAVESNVTVVRPHWAFSFGNYWQLATSLVVCLFVVLFLFLFKCLYCREFVNYWRLITSLLYALFFSGGGGGGGF